MLLFFIIYLVKPENHNQWLRLEKLDRDERSVKNDGRCEIGGQMGILCCNFFSGMRFSHQLLLPSGTTFHITSFSLSLSLWLFLNLLLILIFLSLLKLFDINTQMGVWKVLIYGRERSVILEAVAHDKHCVLANILAAHFLHSSGSSRALTCLHAAKSNLVPSHLLPTIACFFVLFCFSDSIHQIQKQNTK